LKPLERNPKGHKSKNQKSHNFLINGFETLFTTLCYVKENMEMTSFVALMIKILSMHLHPGYVFEPNPYKTLRYLIDLKSALGE
jgi:hypothetical protein